MDTMSIGARLTREALDRQRAQNDARRAELDQVDSEIRAAALVDALADELARGNAPTARTIKKVARAVAKSAARHDRKRAKISASGGLPVCRLDDMRRAARLHRRVKWITPTIERHIRAGGKPPQSARRSSDAITIGVGRVYGPIDHSAEREARAIAYLNSMMPARPRLRRALLDPESYITHDETRARYARLRRIEANIVDAMRVIQSLAKRRKITARECEILTMVADGDLRDAKRRYALMSESAAALGLTGKHPAAREFTRVLDCGEGYERPKTRGERAALSKARKQRRELAKLSALVRALAKRGIGESQIATVSSAMAQLIA